jgi:hypothetical protein
MPVASADEPAVIALKQVPIEAVNPTGEVVAICPCQKFHPNGSQHIQAMPWRRLGCQDLLKPSQADRKGTRMEA